MEQDFSQLFHSSSKKITNRQSSFFTDYKLYPRLPKVSLTEEGILSPSSSSSRVLSDKAFFDLVGRRMSRINFARVPLTRYELSALLKYSCGIKEIRSENSSYRVQPSAGARFPIEVYLIVFRSGDISKNELQSGLYHYNVKEHTLDVLWDREFSDEDIGALFTYPWIRDAAMGLVMTAVFWRTQNTYGERGYRYILIEAGHIGQNIYLISEALGLKCCAFGGTRDKNLEKLIDIDGVTESVVYGFAIGK